MKLSKRAVKDLGKAIEDFDSAELRLVGVPPPEYELLQAGLIVRGLKEVIIDGRIYWTEAYRPTFRGRVIHAAYMKRKARK